ncbi:YdcF family protein [Actinoplanes rectilineatus]|uniref:YdcF family protein n=1 Tax=Actinoplanes rectilineatus TaxID=113571 RepID=UPI000AB524A9|nr:YdcF family protein [Actinoplanes rectilineatus]
MAVTDDIADFVDASAPGLGQADLIFVFGSTLPDAVTPALRAFRAGLAPLIVLTGGPNRRNPAIVESDAHAQLLKARGIPPDQILIERRSRTSHENVSFARPLVEERLHAPRTVIAVVKWWQRRQIHLVAAGLPSVERIYAATWNPPARADGRPYDRTTWASSSDRPRIEDEFGYLRKLLDSGDLPALSRTDAGWTPATPSRSDPAVPRPMIRT